MTRWILSHTYLGSTNEETALSLTGHLFQQLFLLICIAHLFCVLCRSKKVSYDAFKINTARSQTQKDCNECLARSYQQSLLYRTISFHLHFLIQTRTEMSKYSDDEDDEDFDEDRSESSENSQNGLKYYFNPDNEDSEDSKDSKDSEDSEDSENSKDSEDSRDNKDIKSSKDNKGSKGNKDIEDSKTSKHLTSQDNEIKRRQLKITLGFLDQITTKKKHKVVNEDLIIFHSLVMEKIFICFVSSRSIIH